MSNLTDLIDGAAKAFTEAANMVASDARNATDPVEAEWLRKVASTGHSLARRATGLSTRVAEAEKKVADDTAAKADRLRTLVAESRARSGLRDVDPINPAAPLGTQRRRILAGNLIADVGKLGEERICGTATNDGYCVLREGHRPPYYDDDEPLHADAEQAARARRYLIHSDPDKTQRG